MHLCICVFVQCSNLVVVPSAGPWRRSHVSPRSTPRVNYQPLLFPPSSSSSSYIFVFVFFPGLCYHRSTLPYQPSCSSLLLIIMCILSPLAYVFVYLHQYCISFSQVPARSQLPYPSLFFPFHHHIRILCSIYITIDLSHIARTQVFSLEI